MNFGSNYLIKDDHCDIQEECHNEIDDRQLFLTICMGKDASY